MDNQTRSAIEIQDLLYDAFAIRDEYENKNSKIKLKEYIKALAIIDVITWINHNDYERPLEKQDED
jgi:hypothetical protein